LTPSTADQRIRQLRPPKPAVDPYKAHGSLLEGERRPDGRLEKTLTAFLAGSECPYTCSFCDLWRWTTDGPTPPGALTQQLEPILRSVDDPRPDRLKIYNASNFFDRRAVPVEDLVGIAECARPFRALTVESHANTIGASTLEFAKLFSGRLEVAIGLETIHSTALEALNKRLDLERFDRAAGFLSDNDIDLRVFVLLGAPYIEPAEAVEWTVRSVEHAVQRGAAVVSIIPVRGGNGELERLQALGDFQPPVLFELEVALENCLQFQSAVVTADLWDIQLLPGCEECRAARVDRLRLMNTTGSVQAPVSCPTCADEPARAMIPQRVGA
jgi:archaeosine synthase beta-subunit